MAYTRKQVVTCVSIVYLILAMALSGYASSRANRLSIPIPTGLAYATTVLPIVSGLILEGGYDFARQQERQKSLPRGSTPRPPLVIIANTLIFIYSTVVITLLGTHAAPPFGFDCALRERWMERFKHKDGQAIKAIQDAFACCGLKNSRDMAWPFPDRTHGPDACEVAFGHKNGCLEPWKGELQRLAGIFMAVVGLVFIWQFAIIVDPTKRPSWLYRVMPNRVARFLGDEERGNGSARQIDYLPDFSRYSDRVHEEHSDDGAVDEAQRAIEAGEEHTRNTAGGAPHGDNVHANEWSRA